MQNTHQQVLSIHGWISSKKKKTKEKNFFWRSKIISFAVLVVVAFCCLFGVADVVAGGAGDGDSARAGGVAVGDAGGAFAACGGDADADAVPVAVTFAVMMNDDDKQKKFIFVLAVTAI